MSTRKSPARNEGSSRSLDDCKRTVTSSRRRITRPRAATAARGLIDCSERQDTGYSSGNAFAITVVTVDGKPVEVETANAYYVMQQAAAADGVSIAIVSGFRTMAQQEYLYDCYVNCNCNNCNLAARPGYSNHQSGHALDLNTSQGGVLNWLNAHGASFGFMRTVSSEPWHWEWWGGGPGGGPCGRCTPHCEGAEIIGDDCGRGDCAAFGARCVDDAVGVRCASVFCPDTGRTEVCVDDTMLGQCNDGAIEIGDCAHFAAFCSTAVGAARCMSAFCVKTREEVPVAHDTCLPDGQRYRCDENGGLAPFPCPEGQGCHQGECGVPIPPQADDGPQPPLDEVRPAEPAPKGEAAFTGKTGGGCACAAENERDPTTGVLLVVALLFLSMRRRA